MLPQRHGALLFDDVLNLEVLEFGHIRTGQQAHRDAQQNEQDQARGHAEGQIAEQTQALPCGPLINADAQNGQGVGDGGHGSADVDAEHCEDVGHMGIGIPTFSNQSLNLIECLLNNVSPIPYAAKMDSTIIIITNPVNALGSLILDGTKKAINSKIAIKLKVHP